MHLCPPSSHLTLQNARAEVPPSNARRRVALLLNLQARQVDVALLARLTQLVGAEHVYASRSLAEAEAMARRVVHGRYDVVACGGGDGTLSGTFNRLRRYVAEANAWRQSTARTTRPSVAAWLVPSLAFLPLGTGNAVRSVVGNNSLISDLTRLLYDDQLIVDELPVIAMPTGEQFLFGGMGYDSMLLGDYQAFVVDHPAPFCRSLFGYIAAVATRTLPRICRQPALLEARVTSIGEAHYIDPTMNDAPVPLGRNVTLFAGRASLLAMGTIAYFGFGLRVFPFAALVANTMHLRIASLSPPQVLTALPRLWRGTLRDPNRLRDFATEGVHIELTRPFPFQHSGDAKGAFASLTLTVAAQPLRLVRFCVAPAAAALAAS